MLRRALVPLIAIAILAPACRPVAVTRPPIEEVLFERREQGLKSLIAAAKEGRLIPFDQVLVVVSEGLVQQLIEATLPVEQILAERYRVRAESVHVDFDDGFALIQLRGRASLVSDPQTEAEIHIYGGIDIVDLDPQSGILRGRVTILAIDTQHVNVIGVPTPMQRLVDELSREQLKVFEPLLSSIDIPVRLEQNIRVPALDQNGVKIPEASLPVEAAVVDVKAFRGRLWICATARADLAPGARPPAPRASAP